MALVTLTSSNGALISISHEIATRSQVLQNVIKDFEHIQDKDINIPIPEVKEYVLKEIIQWCQNHTRDLSLRDKDSSNKESNDTEFDDWAHELLQIDIDTLFEILVASNYLEVDDLLITGCKTVALLIQDVSMNQNQSFFLEDKLFGLSEELLEMILKQLTRYDYLQYLLKISDKCIPYVTEQIKKELTSEVGFFETAEKGAVHYLRQIVEGWNTEISESENHFCRVHQLSSIPGCWPNNPHNLEFITDGLHVLLGSGLEGDRRSLVIFDVVKATRTIIDTAELIKLEWPLVRGPSGVVTKFAFHSGLGIIISRDNFYCFNLSTSPCEITRLNPTDEFSSLGSKISSIAINKWFICVQQINPSNQPNNILVFSRDFVLKGKCDTTDSISQLHIRGKTIIGITDENRCLKYWQIEDTTDSEMLISPLKTTEIRHEMCRHRSLGLSYSPNTLIMDNDLTFYSGTEHTALFEPPLCLEQPYKYGLGCIDKLAAQHFTIVDVKSTEHNRIISFEITNARCQQKGKRFDFSAALDFGVLLDCQMYFTTVVLFFTSGIARVSIRDHEFVFQQVAFNSSSISGRLRELERRQDVSLVETLDAEAFLASL
ncbi:hypothetical protein V490_09002 [Pseudogymnoascus sp. VKM F-3557]|nr:hypothetical protein V490_09002 [Pseudogymnoascus sp. VKM F-3557]